MIFRETINTQKPTIILLHGGGLSWWSWRSITKLLQAEFHVVTPVIDGHGEDGDVTFQSIRDSAGKILQYIDSNCNGRVFAIGGLSIGAQITVEALSQRANLAEYAIIESALTYPVKGIAVMMLPIYRITYGLTKQRWFAKLQAGLSGLPADMFEQYYQDSLKLSKQSLINMITSNADYSLNDSIRRARAKALIIVGENEIGIMKKSAQRLRHAIRDSQLYIAPKMKHGELSLVHPNQYVELIKGFIGKSDSSVGEIQQGT